MKPSSGPILWELCSINDTTEFVPSQGKGPLHQPLTTDPGVGSGEQIFQAPLASWVVRVAPEPPAKCLIAGGALSSKVHKIEYRHIEPVKRGSRGLSGLPALFTRRAKKSGCRKCCGTKILSWYQLNYRQPSGYSNELTTGCCL